MLIVGQHCPDNKSLSLSLQHVYGVNTNTSLKICAMLGVHHNISVRRLIKAGRGDTLSRLCRDHISTMAQHRVNQNVQQYVKLKHYKGVRHMFGLPTRGQRTRTNASTSRRLSIIKQSHSKKRASGSEQKRKHAR